MIGFSACNILKLKKLSTIVLSASLPSVDLKSNVLGGHCNIGAKALHQCSSGLCMMA
jgi:hypothetical protein